MHLQAASTVPSDALALSDAARTRLATGLTKEYYARLAATKRATQGGGDTTEAVAAVKEMLDPAWIMQRGDGSGFTRVGWAGQGCLTRGRGPLAAWAARGDTCHHRR